MKPRSALRSEADVGAGPVPARTPGRAFLRRSSGTSTGPSGPSGWHGACPYTAVLRLFRPVWQRLCNVYTPPIIFGKFVVLLPLRLYFADNELHTSGNNKVTMWQQTAFLGVFNIFLPHFRPFFAKNCLGFNTFSGQKLDFFFRFAI